MPSRAAPPAISQTTGPRLGIAVGLLPLCQMDYGSGIEIRQASPLSRRRRRRAQQQSTCCGCFLLTLILVASAVAVYPYIRAARDRRDEIRRVRGTERHFFPAQLATAKREHLHYEVVEVTLRLSDPQGRGVRPTTLPKVGIRHKGQRVEGVGGGEFVKLHYDASRQVFRGTWPVPWNAEPGTYVVETRYKVPEPADLPWETPEEELHRKRSAPDDRPASVAGDAFCVARARFEVRRVAPPPPDPALCVATWEQILPGPGTRIRKPSGQMGDWRAVFDWCEFMGADTLWVRAAVTQAEQQKLTLEKPFVEANFRVLPVMAAEAHRRGLKFGAWAMAYATLPTTTNSGKPEYRFAQDISRSTRQIKDTTFVSLLDRQRLGHLADFMSAMQLDPNVDHVGLDYIRTEAAYELVDGFVRTMPVDLPRNWEQMSKQDRWLYVARRVEPPGCYEHRGFWEMWNWYRAHMGAGLVAEMLQRSQLKKPLWTFVLSWRHGQEHGQDPLMLTDAGVSMLAPMLYQTDVGRFNDFILKEWPQYVRSGQVNLVAGDQIDDVWHQKLGPAEMYRRMVSAHLKLLAGGRTQGTFVHDISRAAVRGILGPYPATEWALAGGAAFSVVRRSWQVYPLTADFTLPAAAAVGAPVPVTLILQGVGERAVSGIKIEPMQTEGIELSPSGTQSGSVGPGQSLTVPFKAKITGANQFRQNRFMVAFRVTWPQGDYGDRVRTDLPRVIIVMKYIKAS